MNDSYAMRPFDDLWRGWIVAAGKDIDCVAVPRQVATYLVNIDVLPPCIHSTQQCGGVSMLAEKCYPYRSIHEVYPLLLCWISCGRGLFKRLSWLKARVQMPRS